MQVRFLSSLLLPAWRNIWHTHYGENVALERDWEFESPRRHFSLPLTSEVLVMPDIPNGYRELDAGETVKRGDLYNSSSGGWERPPKQMIGLSAPEGDHVTYIRRDGQD